MTLITEIAFNIMTSIIIVGSLLTLALYGLIDIRICLIVSLLSTLLSDWF